MDDSEVIPGTNQNWDYFRLGGDPTAIRKIVAPDRLEPHGKEHGQPEENDVANQLDEIQLQLDRIENQIALLVDIGKRVMKIEEGVSDLRLSVESIEGKTS